MHGIEETSWSGLETSSQHWRIFVGAWRLHELRLALLINALENGSSPRSLDALGSMLMDPYGRGDFGYDRSRRVIDMEDVFDPENDP